MAIPDYQTLMLPVLKRAAQGETRVPEVEEKIAAEFGLTPEERNHLLPSGRQKILHNHIHWAKSYMSKAGLIDSPRRGWFKATETGLAFLAKNPSRIDVKLLSENPDFKDFYRGGHGNGNILGTEETPTVAPLPVAAATPEEQIESIYAAAQTALRADLLQRILQNTPSFFEGLLVDLLVAMGYGGSHRNAATQLGRSGDGGIDGVIDEDRLGLDRVYVQAKCFAPSNSIGRPEVQALSAVLLGLERRKAFSSRPQGSVRTQSTMPATWRNA